MGNQTLVNEIAERAEMIMGHFGEEAIEFHDLYGFSPPRLVAVRFEPNGDDVDGFQCVEVPTEEVVRLVHPTFDIPSLQSMVCSFLGLLPDTNQAVFEGVLIQFQMALEPGQEPSKVMPFPFFLFQAYHTVQGTYRNAQPIFDDENGRSRMRPPMGKMEFSPSDSATALLSHFQIKTP